MKAENDTKIVYVVHCVDTEGPLFEEDTVPFEMVKNIFGIEIEPSKENLKKLQNGEINLNGYEQEIQKLVDAHRITTRGNWDEIDEMLRKVTSEQFRMSLPDSTGGGWIFNWFCMAHVGFTGKNPRRRVEGYHAIRDHYVDLIKRQNSKDYIGFHYHPVSISGNYNDSGTAYWGGENLNQIFCRNILERGWFPSAFRPGFHTERPDSNWFLEQWIPFDFGNQATKNDTEGQIDLAAGRFGDWRHAPVKWYPYHPAHDDYQAEGSCRRWITRCLNMYARTRQISQKDIEDAFEDARLYGKAILSFTDHDYKDMEYEICRVQQMLKNAAEKYPQISFEYVNAVEAMRRCLDLKYEEFNLNVDLIKTRGRIYLDILVDKDIFGPQPFLAIKTKDGRYFWDNLDFYKSREWRYTFDNNTIDFEQISEIGVAANNQCGVTKVVVLSGENIEEYSYNLKYQNTKTNF